MNALLVDVGNSRIKWRFDDTRGAAPSGASGRAADGAVDVAALDALRDAWRARASWPIDAVVVSAVASEAVETQVAHAARATWPRARVERIVATARRAGIVNGYRQPSQLGPDRWLALIGAHTVLPGRSLLVCGFGTATTLDFLAVTDGGAHFVGGTILPGPDTMRRSLLDGTARLSDGPGQVVDFADNTRDAIAGGLVHAQAGAVERAWRAAAALLGGEPPCCVLVGGAAEVFAAVLSARAIEQHVVPDAVLIGLGVCAREATARAPAASVD